MARLRSPPLGVCVSATRDPSNNDMVKIGTHPPLSLPKCGLLPSETQAPFLLSCRYASTHESLRSQRWPQCTSESSADRPLARHRPCVQQVGGCQTRCQCSSSMQGFRAAGASLGGFLVKALLLHGLGAHRILSVPHRPAHTGSSCTDERGRGRPAQASRWRATAPGFVRRGPSAGDACA